MPKIYRAMRRADDGKPVVEATGKGLGVRGTPVNGVVDVDLDENGAVVMNKRGMSVTPVWRDLPYFLVPKRLIEQSPRARGSNAMFCFTMGEGSFEDGPLTEGLDLIRDTPKHGLIVPRAIIALERFQAALANTRDLWTIDEN